MIDESVIKGLNGLLAKNYDAEKGYLSAAEETNNQMHAALFRSKANQRYEFGHQIKDLLKISGGHIDKGTSVAGDLHRAWFNFKSFLSFDKEEMLLEEIERGEEASLDEYSEFLDSYELPVEVRGMILNQKSAILRSLNRVERMEKEMD